MIKYSSLTTQFCRIILVGDHRGLSGLHLDTGEGKRQFSIDSEWLRDDTLFHQARRQIEAYCQGELTRFSLPLRLEGTDFQKSVWQALVEIPYGEVKSYGEIAKAIGKPKACRAVGMANSKNPIPLIIPCHRVIGINGKLTGFAHGLNIKSRLLEFEHDHRPGK